MIENNGKCYHKPHTSVNRSIYGLKRAFESDLVSKTPNLLTECAVEGDLVSKRAILLTEWVFEGDLVSKRAILLTEWVFEGDLVSKRAVLLTELVFESDLVSKMAYLLTELGVRRARCANRPNNCRVRAIKALFDRNLYGFLPSTITHLVLRLVARKRNRRAYRNSGVETAGLPRLGRSEPLRAEDSSKAGVAKLRGGKGRSKAAGASCGGPKTQRGRLVRVAAEAVRPASEPLALLYRILCLGARPARHSRGNVSGVRRSCHTRRLRGAKQGGAE